MDGPETPGCPETPGFLTSFGESVEKVILTWLAPLFAPRCSPSPFELLATKLYAQNRSRHCWQVKARDRLKNQDRNMYTYWKP